MTSKQSTSAVVLGITAVALTLSACGSPSSPSAASSGTAAGATTATTASSAVASPASSTASSPASSTPASAPASSAAPSAPVSSPSAPATASTPAGATATPSGPVAGSTPLCTASRLTGSVSTLPGGGAAGSVYTGVTVRNTSDAACTLSGYPGVSFVASGSGEQIGVPAQRDETRPPVAITLDPGRSAQAVLRITRAENYGQVCNIQPAAGFRVYPPSATDALFLPSTTARACANEKIVLLHIGAFQPLA